MPSKKPNQKLSRREFLRMSTAATGGLLLASCTSAEPDSSDSSDPAVEAAVVSLWSFPRTEDDVTTIFNPLLEKFQADNPNIDVDIEILPWGGRREKMLTAYAGGENPDMALMQNDMLSLMGLNGVLSPLNNLVDAERQAEIPDSIIRGVSWGDDLILMPFAFSADTFVWNKGLANEIGWTGDAPATWDDMRKLGALAAGKNVFGWSHSNWAWSRWIELTWQAGGTVFNEDATKALLTEPAGVETLSFIVEMFNNAWVPKEGNVGSAEENSGVSLNYFFTNEQVISQPDDADIINIINEEAPDMDWGGLAPTKNKATGVLASIDAWGLFNNSEAKDAAAKWISFLTKPESEGFISSNTGISPLTDPAKAFWEADEKLKEFAGSYVSVAQSNQDTGWYWQEGKTVLAPEIQAAVLGDKSVEQALADAQAGLQALIDRDASKR